MNLTAKEFRALFPDASEETVRLNCPDASVDAKATHPQGKKSAKHPLAAMSEAEFQAQIIELAEAHGWIVKHISDSRREVRGSDGESKLVGDKLAAGIPDLLLIKPPTVLLVELKRQTGKTTAEQDRVLGALYRCDRFGAHLWRPSDLDAALIHLAA